MANGAANGGNPAVWTISTVAGTGSQGHAGDGGPATAALLNNPFDLAFDANGDLVFSDTYNHRICRIAKTTGIITTIAGTGEAGFSGDGGPAAKAGLVEPNGLALDADHGRLFITDVADHRVRVVDLRSGVIGTFAGTGEARHDGDGGPATQAGVFGARAVALAPDGALYVMERQGSSIRVVRDGIITTIAGTGARGYAGDGGSAIQAVFDAPKEMAVNPASDIFVVDTENHVIRLIDAGTGLVHTIAGNGKAGPGGDGGPATAAGLARPHGAAVGPDGAVYIGDSENHRIRKLTRIA